MNDQPPQPLGVNVAGTVRWQHGGRVEGGLVLAAKAGSPPLAPASIDDDGDYKVTGVDEGEWRMTGFHSNARPANLGIKVERGGDLGLVVTALEGKESQEIPVRELEAGGLECKLDFRLESLTRSISRWGGSFVVLLMALFVAGVVAYAWTHVSFPMEPATPYADALRALGSSAQKASDPDSGDPGKVVSQSSKEMSAVLDAMPKETRDAVRPLFEQLELQVGEIKTVADKVAKLDETLTAMAAGEARQKATAERNLSVGELRTAIAELDNKTGSLQAREKEIALANPASFFWSKGRRVWLEILCWAFFGIMTRLIVSCGWYVYKDRFYKRAVWQHASLLLVVPGLTLVLVLVLSLFSLNFPIEGGDSVAIELSNPLILAAVSFLVACVPWKLWNRIRETGEQMAATGKG